MQIVTCMGSTSVSIQLVSEGLKLINADLKVFCLSFQPLLHLLHVPGAFMQLQINSLNQSLQGL